MLTQSWHDCDNIASIWNSIRQWLTISPKHQWFPDYQVRLQDLLVHLELFFVGNDIVLYSRNQRSYLGSQVAIGILGKQKLGCGNLHWGCEPTM